MSSSEQPAFDPETLVGHILPQNKLRLVSLLGKGSYGQIYVAESINKPIPHTYAVKRIAKANLTPQEAFWQWNEVQLMQTLQKGHPNVIKFYGVIQEGDTVWCVMEKARMDMYDALKKINENLKDGERPKGFEVDVVKEIFLEVCDALAFCHRNGVAHRDIKLENILVGEDYRVRLCDFGLSTEGEWSNDFGVGSIKYMAPECYHAQFFSSKFRVSTPYKTKYNTYKADVWSLGVLLFALVLAHSPWKKPSMSDKTFAKFHKENDYLTRKFDLTPDFHEILTRCFEIDPSKRADIDELKTLVAGVNFFTNEQKRQAESVVAATMVSAEQERIRQLEMQAMQEQQEQMRVMQEEQERVAALRLQQEQQEQERVLLLQQQQAQVIQQLEQMRLAQEQQQQMHHHQQHAHHQHEQQQAHQEEHVSISPPAPVHKHRDSAVDDIAIEYARNSPVVSRKSSTSSNHTTFSPVASRAIAYGHQRKISNQSILYEQLPSPIHEHSDEGHCSSPTSLYSPLPRHMRPGSFSNSHFVSPVASPSPVAPHPHSSHKAVPPVPIHIQSIQPMPVPSAQPNVVKHAPVEHHDGEIARKSSITGRFKAFFTGSRIVTGLK